MNNIIGVINSGVGNIYSVNKALKLFDVKVVNFTNQDELFSCDKVIIRFFSSLYFLFWISVFDIPDVLRIKFLIDPKTGKEHSIFTKKGKLIMKYYINNLMNSV